MGGEQLFELVSSPAEFSQVENYLTQNGWEIEGLTDLGVHTLQQVKFRYLDQDQNLVTST